MLHDGALWALLALPPVIWAADAGVGGRLWPDLVFPLGALAGAVGMRRRLPLPALAVCAALSGLDPLSPVDRYTPAVAVMGFLAGRRVPGAARALGWMSGVVALAVLAGLPFGRPERTLAYDALVLPLVTVVPWLMGRYLVQRRELLLAGWERADRLEREQRLVAERARLLERARIARDMHDGLGHELSLIALMAGNLQVSAELDERHRAVAAHLRAAASAATQSLQDIIGLLRAGEQEESAVSQTVEEVVRRAAESGLDVRLTVAGEGAGVPHMVRRAAFRVVQESVTNAAKHAPGAPVRVRVTYGEDETEVRVTNGPAPGGEPYAPDPYALDAGGAGRGGGHGLAGLGERARLLGGSVRYGPREGGFEVAARLPHRAGPGPLAPAPAPPGAVAGRSGRVLRRARGGFVLAFGLPLGVAVLLGMGAAGYLYQTQSSVLRPEVFQSLVVGQPRAQVAARLPVNFFDDSPSPIAEGPPPAGASCAYYVSTGDLFVRPAVYRLCFGGGALVAKDAYPPAD
ncbi:ATP-binding protein [Bailinhaonella thermotolerans]|uniref:histidine kinase n=1 Tax=Bailinhaonella thermotolerans TaxID=1070861 RepID=A0A3A4B8R9_9ACTN|nr:ATP-binding protein [Bailinhaonella thermotolerans]